MKQAQEGRSQYSSSRIAIIFSVFLAVLGLLFAAGWAFENKGIYLLPEKMCGGVLARDTVRQVLPGARSADSRTGSRGAGENLSFRCQVTTSDDSSLSGEASVRQLSRDDWLEYYRSAGGATRIVHVSLGDIEALAQIDSGGTASVYIPCSPPDVPKYNASRPYAVVGEAWVRGSAKVKGAPLRQVLTDFTYRLGKRAYRLAECKTPRDLPQELPRYKDS